MRAPPLNLMMGESNSGEDVRRELLDDCIEQLARQPRLLGEVAARVLPVAPAPTDLEKPPTGAILAPQKSLWRACFPRRRVTGTLSGPCPRQRISCPAIA